MRSGEPRQLIVESAQQLVENFDEWLADSPDRFG